MQLSYVTVPEGMSCVNALYALWRNSTPASFFASQQVSPRTQAAAVSTAEKVAELFKTRTYFDYVGGRVIKTDFAKFPQLNARLYDRDLGDGAANKTIEKYNSIPSEDRFDKGDSYKFEDLVKNTNKQDL